MNRVVFKFKTAWLGQQLDELVSANKHALKSIDKTVQCSKVHTGRKELLIPVGNLMLYCMIILNVGTRFKISISLTFMW